MISAPVIIWLRQDLRLADNPALCEATGRPVIPLFIWDETAPHPPGAASRWWLYHSLTALAAALQKRGSRLVVRRGIAAEQLNAVIAESGAEAVYWNRCYEPAARARDTAIKAALTARGLDVRSFKANLLHEPWEVSTGQGKPYKVFTPYYRACLEKSVGAPLPTPTQWACPHRWPVSDCLNEWPLRPQKPDWAGGLRATWQPGEAGAHDRLGRFIDQAVTGYADHRNIPGLPGTSMLSPHLHWGEISPRQIWHAVKLAETANPRLASGSAAFLREVGWRDFSFNLLYHFPDLPTQPFNPTFAGFPWSEDARLLRAWQRGQTGIPLVDAGMRELWHTGYMHNRVRMVVGSFLVKHLLQPWQAGEAWFWDTLVDADLANNAASWQWIAGCGADAAPYFRVFNPVLQGEKFDSEGIYVRRWVPELAGLPNKFLHQPWSSPDFVLRQANVKLGLDYPRPIIDLNIGRDRALAAYKIITGRNNEGVENDMSLFKHAEPLAGGAR